MNIQFEEYTKKYEYAATVVKAFIQSEDSIAKKSTGSKSIYDESSWIHNFFTFNLISLTNSNVEATVEKMMNREETETRAFNPPLSRINSLYQRLSMALGNEYMEDMKENLILSLVSLTGADMTNRRQVKARTGKFKKILDKYPSLILAPIGSFPFIQLKTESFSAGVL